MNKVPFLAISLLLTGVCRSQMLSPASIGSSGSMLISNKRSLSYTANNLSAPVSQNYVDSMATAGLADNKSNNDKSGLLVVYPNPAADNLWYSFKLNGQGKVVVSLYNCLGQKMQDASYNNYANTKVVERFDVSMLPAGNYMLSLKFVNSKDQVSQILNRKFQVIN